MVWKILLALLFFSFMIFAHEFGHFITARMFKVGVKEFSIGMGPKLISRRSNKSGTLYALRLLPIGGFVSLVGEDENSEDENALNKKPWYQRFVILFAGSGMNILTAIITMFIILASSPYYASCVVADSPNYPIEESVLYGAGIMDGDRIVEINGEKMKVYQDISYKIMLDGAEPLDITVERNGEKILFEDIQFTTDEEDGVTFGMPDFSVYAQKKTLKALLYETVYESFSTVKVIYDSLIGLITGKYGVEAVSGPVGTVNAIAESASMGVRTLATLFVFISMNLGIFNLLPIPALDGGRLVFVLIEAVRRKPIKPEHEGYVHLAGMILLFGFMAIITFKDIFKLF
ncbi:MAG: site-2 protease family protein [Clostridia bacterium]|nr:site-2 protease family protein [Clostridia bacterium]